MNKLHQHIERRITIGVITSTDYLRKFVEAYSPDYIIAPQARLLISWCTEYFNTHDKAPNKDIQEIFLAREQEIEEDQAELIGDVLDGMSDEYNPEQFNHEYLWEQTKEYFKERHLKLFSDRISGYIETGDVQQAEITAEQYKPVKSIQTEGIYPFEDKDAIKDAFKESNTPLIQLKGALGNLLNPQLVREGFVTFLGHEKIGKSFILMELGFQGIMSGVDTAFFQAGDMSQAQQIRRQGMYLTGRSNLPKFCKELYVPVLDCIKNQRDECNSNKRTCAEGPFHDLHEKEISKLLKETYIEAHEEYPDYKPCIRCKNKYTFKGAIWYRKREPVHPLGYRDAKKALTSFGRRYKARFKLATYPNETLDTKTIENQLWLWEMKENFVPSLIIIDYADIMTPDKDCKALPFREQENKKWQRLRRISQNKKSLLITATQADADAYNAEILGAKNFSETKTKHAHITAEYGLNQKSEEKKKGILRINPIMIRDDEFDIKTPVTVLQSLQTGRPFVGSYL